MFFLAVLFGAVVLYLPGTLFALALRMRRLEAILIAPPLTLAAYFLLGVLSGLVESVPWFCLPLGALLLAAIVYLVSRTLVKDNISLVVSRAGEHEESSNDWGVTLLYLAVSLIVMFFTFIMTLDGPTSVMQHSDNTWHLGLTRVIAETGNYSALRSTVYPSALGSGAIPFAEHIFYPNSWHVIGSFMMSALRVPSTLAENATNFLFAAVVYPLAMCALMRKLFEDNPGIIKAGAFVVQAFVAFPLGMYLFGPLYPNVAAFTCAPIVAVLFICAVEAGPIKDKVAGAALFCVASLGAVSLQPNVVFTAAVFLAPYCVFKIYVGVRAAGHGARLALAASAFFALLVAVIWYALYRAPFMQGVVTFGWPPMGNGVQGAANVLTLGLRALTPQVFMAFLVLLGIAGAVLHREWLWFAIAFILMSVLYAIGTSNDGFLRDLLTGFWYSDPWRTSACVVMMAVPLAAIGLRSSLSWLRDVTVRMFDSAGSVTNKRIALGFWMALYLLLAFYPSFNYGTQRVETAFGAVTEEITANNLFTNEQSYTGYEHDFVEKVKQVVPAGALIINFPSDGSLFAYDIDDLNVYYKSATGGAESPTSLSIRQGLSKYASDSSVRDAVASTGAQYVLLLDKNGFDDQGDYQWSIYAAYSKNEWHGLIELADGTPGFETVLAEQNMRLYRIVQ